MTHARGTVLLVDDEAKILKTLGRALGDDGHEVFTVAAPDEALRLATSRPPSAKRPTMASLRAAEGSGESNSTTTRTALCPGSREVNPATRRGRSRKTRASFIIARVVAGAAATRVCWRSTVIFGRLRNVTSSHAVQRAVGVMDRNRATAA